MGTPRGADFAAWCSVIAQGHRVVAADAAPPPQETLWRAFRDELASLQDEPVLGASGHVLNPISQSVYVRDTAFAAQIFATEYARTGGPAWLERAKAALNALAREDVYAGVDEPVWSRTGWRPRRGSMSGTAMLLDALWEAERLLKFSPASMDTGRRVQDYVRTCHLGNGLYAHDSVRPGTSPAAVQNTTAMALFLLTYAEKVIGSEPAGAGRDRRDTYVALRKGQMGDGFWPYAYPRPIQKLLGGNAAMFGDAVHHCLVMYYVARCALLDETHEYDDMLRRGWDWVERHLVRGREGALRFSFAWEPVPTVPRHCNFRETTTYFLILAAHRLLCAQGILGSSSTALATALLSHVTAHLMAPVGVFPSVIAYEGPVEITRNILPRVGESVAWKGACLAPLVLAAQRGA